MGTVGIATEGTWFNKKMVQINQQNIVENLNRYYHQEFKEKTVRTLKIISIMMTVIPLAWAALRLIWMPYIMREDELSVPYAIAVIIGCVILAGLGVWLMHYINKKYSHAIYLQNPNKERHYRWKYCILFNDEEEDYRAYIKKNPMMCPTGVIPIVILDHQTYRVAKTYAAEDFFTKK